MGKWRVRFITTQFAVTEVEAENEEQARAAAWQKWVMDGEDFDWQQTRAGNYGTTIQSCLAKRNPADNGKGEK